MYLIASVIIQNSELGPHFSLELFPTGVLERVTGMPKDPPFVPLMTLRLMVVSLGLLIDDATLIATLSLGRHMSVSDWLCSLSIAESGFASGDGMRLFCPALSLDSLAREATSIAWRLLVLDRSASLRLSSAMFLLLGYVVV